MEDLPMILVSVFYPFSVSGDVTSGECKSVRDTLLTGLLASH